MLRRVEGLCDKPVEGENNETDKVNEIMAQLLCDNGLFHSAESTKSTKNTKNTNNNAAL